MTSHPTLTGERCLIRPGEATDALLLHGILADPTVSRWWGTPDPVEKIAADLHGDGGDLLLVIEVDGAVAGGIQYSEENEPDYRHAGIDIYLGAAAQGRGIGTEAVSLMARFLIAERRHHRITIDPAAANELAIRCYEKVGFRRVGVMRDYERGPDGVFHDGLLMDLLAGDLAG